MLGGAQMIIQRVGAASLPALLDRSDAREELQKVPGIGPFKSEKIKVSWDRSRHLLPEAALEPPPPPQQQPEAAASAAAAEIVWDAGTRCYAPAMFRAEATVASVLSRLAAQPVLEPPRTGSLSGSERVERWITNNEKSTSTPTARACLLACDLGILTVNDEKSTSKSLVRHPSCRRGYCLPLWPVRQ